MKLACILMSALLVSVALPAGATSSEAEYAAPYGRPVWIFPPPPDQTPVPPPSKPGTRPGPQLGNKPYSNWINNLPSAGCALVVQLTDVDLRRPPGDNGPTYGDGKRRPNPIAITQYKDNGPNGCSCTISLEAAWYLGNRTGKPNASDTVAHELCHCAQGALGMFQGQWNGDQIEQGADACAAQLISAPDKTPTTYIVPKPKMPPPEQPPADIQIQDTTNSNQSTDQ